MNPSHGECQQSDDTLASYWKTIHSKTYGSYGRCPCPPLYMQYASLHIGAFLDAMLKYLALSSTMQSIANVPPIALKDP